MVVVLEAACVDRCRSQNGNEIESRPDRKNWRTDSREQEREARDNTVGAPCMRRRAVLQQGLRARPEAAEGLVRGWPDRPAAGWGACL